MEGISPFLQLITGYFLSKLSVESFVGISRASISSSASFETLKCAHSFILFFIWCSHRSLYFMRGSPVGMGLRRIPDIFLFKPSTVRYYSPKFILCIFKTTYQSSLQRGRFFQLHQAWDPFLLLWILTLFLWLLPISVWLVLLTELNYSP